MGSNLNYKSIILMFQSLPRVFNSYPPYLEILEYRNLDSHSDTGKHSERRNSIGYKESEGQGLLPVVVTPGPLTPETLHQVWENSGQRQS